MHWDVSLKMLLLLRLSDCSVQMSPDKSETPTRTMKRLDKILCGSQNTGLLRLQ